MKYFKTTLAAALLAGVSSLAQAVPTLQVGIQGGSYSSSTESSVTSSSVFSLFAYLVPARETLLTDTYKLSIALTPAVSSPSSLGSFTINGGTVNVTSDMFYGTPPLDTFLPHDPLDLGMHDVFPTYFYETAFTFSSSNQSAQFNVQEQPAWGPQTGSGMYFKQFDIDASLLAAGYGLHFDLYNTTLGAGGDVDANKFAPFSHDAEYVPSVPEPQALFLLGLGLLGLALARRKNA